MIEVLVGNIASGKGTYARKRAKQGAIIINDDAFTMALHGGEYSCYSEKNKPLYKSIEMHTISVAVAMGLDIIVDRPNVTKNCRQKYIGLGQSLDQLVVARVFPRVGTEVHAQRRFDHDARGLQLEQWRKVAAFFDGRWQKPTMDEGFDQITHMFPELNLA